MTREPLTRYELKVDALFQDGDRRAHFYEGDAFYRVADIEARDAAREAEIRKLAEYVKHKEGCAADDWLWTNDGTTKEPACTCGLAALLTPPQESTREERAKKYPYGGLNHGVCLGCGAGSDQPHKPRCKHRPPQERE